MSFEDAILIEADDCLPFKKEGNGEAIQHFVTKISDFEVFRFGKSKEDELPLAQFDLKAGAWRAGRLVGEAYFDYERQKYKIEIHPRFGTAHLFRMLEEVFNVRLSESQHAYDNTKSKQQLIRKLISFLWLNLLAKGNRHGLPRASQEMAYYGSKIRGHLNVRDSLIPVKTEQKVVSNYRQKTFDARVIKLLKGAYEKLLSGYYLGGIKQPQNAKHALDQLNRISGPIGRLSKREFKRIKVKRIYQPFKPVIDLSWDIIRNNRDANQQKGNEQSFSYFIDMAEIWEMYLRSLLKKRLSLDEWSLLEQEIITYPDKLFKRGLIPDIVFKKGNQVIVFDAKYKRMEFDSNDFDRSDFFQIHTYIQYFQQDYRVIAAGLLYPFSKEFDENRQTRSLSDSLFGKNSEDTKFFIEGIDLTNFEEYDFEKEEKKFLDRMELIIHD